MVVENDGDRATEATDFTVTVQTGGPGDTTDDPLAPMVDVHDMKTDEDGAIVLDVEVTKDPADTTNPTLTVVVSGVPDGAVLTGARFDPTASTPGNRVFIADASVVNAGGVSVTPPPDFSGDLALEIDATATSGQKRVSTNDVPVIIEVEPVADGPAITLESLGGDEDADIPVTIALATTDADGSESVLYPITVTVSAGTLNRGTDKGGGVYELSEADLAGLALKPPTHDDADITVTVAATSVELATLGSANEETKTTTATITVAVEAVPDPVTLTTDDVSGDEDTAIDLTGLSVTLIDPSETLSVTIAGVPEGSILSAGANNGDGSWTIPVAGLNGPTLTPPANWSGTMDLSLVAYTLEPNGESLATTKDFTVTVDPVADGVVFAPLPQSGEAGTPIALDLDVQPGDATGTDTGENPAETLTIVLTAPEAFTASIGGVTATADSSIRRTGEGEWTFTGTAADANALDVTADIIIGGRGDDYMIGGAGADLFVWRGGDADDVDIITDFDASEGDVLDIADLIASYDPEGGDAVTDYVDLTDDGSLTIVSIDPGGAGNHTVDVVELSGVTGQDIQSLVEAGTIVV